MNIETTQILAFAVPGIGLIAMAIMGIVVAAMGMNLTTLRADAGKIDYTNDGSSSILSDAVVILRSGTAGRCGIAMADIAAGATGTVITSGCHELAAASGEAWVEGQTILYWDSGNSRLTSTAGSNNRIGTASKAKASAATTGVVELGAY